MNLDHLNPPQREAVTHVGGPLLVLAGAGSGKTRVITFRIASLLERGVPPRAIAALTFTNKAAAEMRERVGALVGDPRAASQLTIGTFHSLGLQILKTERKALGFGRGFVIYDAADQLGCIREILRTINFDGGRRFDVKAIQTRISLAKNAFVAPDEYAPAEGDEYDEITAEVYPRYREALGAYAAVDFDDLITETVRLIDREDRVRERWSNRFQYVMVDEFQDTNRAQLLMVKHFVAHHNNLVVVGDDDQSIYSWRGADPTNILQFDRMFPGARVVKLEQNYRSTTTILDAANALIAHNTQRHDKKLWSRMPGTDPIVHAVAPTVDAEARWVAEEIEALRKQGYSYRDFAVLYRSNIQTKVLEEELRVARVPYTMFGGQQFFERKEVKDVIAYVRLALNDRDEISLRRIVNYPSRGIGPTTLQKVAALSHEWHTSMWNVLTRIEEWGAAVRPAQRRALVGFVELVLGLRAQLERGVVAAARDLVEHIDLYGDIRAASSSVIAAQRRIDNVEGLFRSLERQEAKKPGTDSLAEYLRLLSLDTSDEKDGNESGDNVVMTTLHGAKGLEFPVVFMVGLEENLLPHARTLMPSVSDVSDPDHCSDVSEERRLTYVGITRAKRRLYLTRSVYRSARGRQEARTPSRFLFELPEDLLEVIDIAEQARQQVAPDEVRAFFSNVADLID